MFKEIREYENFHIVLWLLKDTCWALGWETGGMIMIVPTLIAGIYIAYRSRKVIADLFHNIAVCFWITANGIWMFGEFYFNDGLRNYALVFFALGLIVVGFYYIFKYPKKKNLLINAVEYPKSK
jgi:hypothetical protein